MNSRRPSLYLRYGIQGAEDIARLVFKFIEAVGLFIDRLDKEEEVRLPRVRTKKNELVILPSMSLLPLSSVHVDAIPILNSYQLLGQSDCEDQLLTYPTYEHYYNDALYFNHYKLVYNKTPTIY